MAMLNNQMVMFVIKLVSLNCHKFPIIKLLIITFPIIKLP